VSPVKYELGFFIPEDDIFHSHRRENLTSYISGALSLGSVASREMVTSIQFRSYECMELHLLRPLNALGARLQFYNLILKNNFWEEFIAYFV
jgi:hypothetical protein